MFLNRLKYFNDCKWIQIELAIIKSKIKIDRSNLSVIEIQSIIYAMNYLNCNVIKHVTRKIINLVENCITI